MGAMGKVQESGNGQDGGLLSLTPDRLTSSRLPSSSHRAIKVSAIGHDDRPNPSGQRRNVVEQRERREVIAAAGVVAPPLAAADQNAAVVAHGGLGDLNVDPLVMQRDLATDGHSCLVVSQVVGSGREAKRSGELAQPRTGGCVKAALLLGRISAGQIPVHRKLLSGKKKPGAVAGLCWKS